MIFGGPAEFQTRADGLPGLTKHYGVTFSKFITTDTGGPVTVTALKNGRIDAADLFTTDPSIKANDFVILTDPKSNFAAQNIVPIVNKAKANQGTQDVLNAISAKLTTADLGTLVGAVQNDKKDPETVAKQWLTDHPLGTAANAASGATLTVGSANFPENVVLAWIYADALKSAGANVTTKLNIGSREKYFPALKSGSIDVFPEYNGAVLSYLDKNATASSTADVDAALAKALPSSLIALKSSSAEDSDAIVVTKATAEKYKLTSIADLAKPAS
ncbi:glycine betaine ABC transporter substrate-binding protein [Branchiibius cervicis]|uniref:Glycine betaine ABC transporter substrate-binding protein n=1 Tax=Branchiibius cervicis TaxID=908252 RepID=A0ABW2AT06_9MICO